MQLMKIILLCLLLFQIPNLISSKKTDLYSEQRFLKQKNKPVTKESRQDSNQNLAVDEEQIRADQTQKLLKLIRKSAKDKRQLGVVDQILQPIQKGFDLIPKTILQIPYPFDPVDTAVADIGQTVLAGGIAKRFVDRDNYVDDLEKVRFQFRARNLMVKTIDKDLKELSAIRAKADRFGSYFSDKSETMRHYFQSVMVEGG